MKFVVILFFLALAATVWGFPQVPQSPPSPDSVPEVPIPLVRVARQIPGADQAGAAGGMVSNVPGFNEAKGIADMGVGIIPDAPGISEAKGMYSTATGMMG